jgi:hypothetical protein
VHNQAFANSISWPIYDQILTVRDRASNPGKEAIAQRGGAVQRQRAGRGARLFRRRAAGPGAGHPSVDRLNTMMESQQTADPAARPRLPSLELAASPVEEAKWSPYPTPLPAGGSHDFYACFQVVVLSEIYFGTPR